MNTPKHRALVLTGTCDWTAIEPAIAPIRPGRQLARAEQEAIIIKLAWTSTEAGKGTGSGPK